MTSSIERAKRTKPLNDSRPSTRCADVAALAVVFYHVQGALNRGDQAWFPDSMRQLAGGGHFGVNVFFVLSGFVIARSVRDGSMTPAYLGRFTLRRSVRLDPPYWSAIAARGRVDRPRPCPVPVAGHAGAVGCPTALPHRLPAGHPGLRAPHPDLLDALLRVPVLPCLCRHPGAGPPAHRSAWAGVPATAVLAARFAALFIASVGDAPQLAHRRAPRHRAGSVVRILYRRRGLVGGIGSRPRVDAACCVGHQRPGRKASRFAR